MTDLGWPVAQTTFTGNPSLVQRFIRVTEVMAVPPSLPGDAFPPEDYEFLVTLVTWLVKDQAENDL